MADPGVCFSLMSCYHELEIWERASHRGCQLAQCIFQLASKSHPLAVPGASLEGSEGSVNLLSAALQRHHQKTYPGVAITCVQCSSQTKPYSLPLWQQVPQNGINWPNSHVPVESVPSPFPFPYLCSLLYTSVINHVVGMWVSESLCKWMQIIHSKKPHFLFLGYQETGLTGSRRPWERTGSKDGAQEWEQRLSVGKGHKTHVCC